MVYLDHNATTPLDERVLEAMLPYLRGRYGNPSSVYALGREARAALEQAREQVAELVSAHPSQVLFTSGGTEANNSALKGVARRAPQGRIAISEVEHASVQSPAAALARDGWQIDTLAVDGEGICHRETLQQALSEQTRMVSVMWANNETGVVQPVAELAEICREQGVIFHTDAVQAAGKLALDFPASGAHLMSLSAHKLYGPKGVGALILDKAVDLEPLLHGGGQERGRRGGTENLAAIVGFGRAAELAGIELAERRRHLLTLRERFEQHLAQALPEAVIFCRDAQRLPNTVYMALPGLEGQTLIMALDQQGIAVSSGSACGSDSSEPSAVLKAMGVESELALGAIRISLGKDNTERDIDTLCSVLVSQVKQLQSLAAATAW
ncbi:MAG: cysteine desulfurase [Gammaproteobacteria bacterium]|nr:cysteine desulfurase [Gammaproteobacteria bacterium]MCW8957950.1 cysteine desulfurase [Gammaproteobacteria bacterium]MCW8972747.1 cysteine desulfurase [Gammaproteobacteria bacterium]MCW8994042.1 cysteine desulfurase [Gammaproteobacteria bacterium]